MCTPRELRLKLERQPYNRKKRGNVMKKAAIALLIVLVVLIICSAKPIPEPVQCAICDDLPSDALCIINLHTGEKLNLTIYEPHPYLVGEIADEQAGGWFSLVQGAGIEGYKVGNEYVKVTIPRNTSKLDQHHFCKACRELLAPYSRCGYVLTDLKVTGSPAVYPITQSACFSIRCYRVFVERIPEKGKYEITITGFASTG